MNERLQTIVDLENYPIHDLSSVKIQKLIKKCKDDLDLFSCSTCLLYTSPSPRDRTRSRMPSSA